VTTFTTEPAGPEGYSRRGFVIADDPKHPIPAVRDGDVTYLPYIGPNSEVGYQCRHTDGRIEYLYFNPSTDEGHGGPDGGPGNNVFLYQGRSGDPAEDSPHHFYYVFDPQDWEEGVNDGPST
jgi:hypothetical protein